MMMFPLAHMKKVKIALEENLKVLILAQTLTHALRILVEVLQSLVNLNQMMKHAMTSHIQTSHKLFNILKPMSHVSQSLRVSAKKMT